MTAQWGGAVVGRCLAVAVAVVGMSSTLTADCADFGDNNTRIWKERSSYGFEGTVTSVERPREGSPYHSATIDVTRVWKGDVPKHFTVYYERGIDFPELTVGRPVWLKPGNTGVVCDLES